MTFEVGDIVEVKEESNNYGFLIGTVVKKMDNLYNVVFDYGDQLCCTDAWIKGEALKFIEKDLKSENMKKEDNMKLEVGDRVTMVGTEHNGCTGTVTGCEKGFYAVKYDQAINGYRCCVELAENMDLLIEEEQKNIYKIADHYGKGIQQLKLIEECGELIVALAKDEDKNVIEELADVSIMLEQVVYLMDCKKKFKIAKAMKISRQVGRMEGEE